jgi:hypothetical protein
MKRWYLPIVAVLTIALCVAFAADFWKTKKYSTWSDEEVKKMIENSPWARKVPVKYPGAKSFGMPGGGMGGPPIGGGGSLPPAPPDTTPKAVLRWQTALPIKEAIARARYKDQVETSEEAAKTLKREEVQYILGVTGLMGSPTAFKTEDLKAGAKIKIGDLPPIPALDVMVDKQGFTTNLFIAFPKAMEGAHRITEADGSVEFELKTPSIEIKWKFNLKEMVYQDKLEI